MNETKPRPVVPRDHRRCKHLREPHRYNLAHHATLTSRTVPENGTDYHWDLTVDLCTLCSGFVAARVQMALDEDHVNATSDIP